LKKKSPVRFNEEEKTLLMTLNERERRHFIACKAAGSDGCAIQPLCSFLRVSTRTVVKGIHELREKTGILKDRIRKPGGGAKDKIAQHPEWTECFLEIVSEHMAGDPQNENTVWLGIKAPAIRKEFIARGHDISLYHVRRLIKEAGFKARSFRKDIPMRKVEGRDAQFEKIGMVRRFCTEHGIPVISIDTKNKELVGNFKRPGSVLCTAAPRAFDHDFATFSKGTIVPHGIYDVASNTGYLTIGTSHDTSEFVCDNIAHYWDSHLRARYPDASVLVILCDGGGSNSSSHHIVKQDFMRLADRIGMKIVMMHYPPYCSKYNPIEHRLFSQVSRSWSGAPLLSVEDASDRAARTTTKTGLRVFSRIVDKVYETGRKVDDGYREAVASRVVFDKSLHNWNYLINHA
jgi:hypothetical protein